MKPLLNQFYYAISHFHRSYVCTAWGQNLNPIHCSKLVQKKAMQIISFACYNAHTLPIFPKLSIVTFSDLVSLCNCLLIYKHFISKSEGLN